MKYTNKFNQFNSKVNELCGMSKQLDMLRKYYASCIDARYSDIDDICMFIEPDTKYQDVVDEYNKLSDAASALIVDIYTTYGVYVSLN